MDFVSKLGDLISIILDGIDLFVDFVLQIPDLIYNLIDLIPDPIYMIVNAFIGLIIFVLILKVVMSFVK